MSHRGDGWRDADYPPQAVLLEETCTRCGKLSYVSRHAANSKIKRVERESRRKGMRDSHLHAYECPRGNGWHIAHARSQGQRTGARPKKREGRLETALPVAV